MASTGRPGCAAPLTKDQVRAEMAKGNVLNRLIDAEPVQASNQYSRVKSA